MACAFHGWEQVNPDHKGQMWKGLPELAPSVASYVAKLFFFCPERVWRRCGEHYAVGNIVQHDCCLVVWGGISTEGCRDLSRLGISTLTGIGYWDEILKPNMTVRCMLVLLVHDNGQPNLARVCWQFLEAEGIDTTDCAPHLPDLNPK